MTCPGTTCPAFKPTTSCLGHHRPLPPCLGAQFKRCTHVLWPQHRAHDTWLACPVRAPMPRAAQLLQAIEQKDTRKSLHASTQLFPSHRIPVPHAKLPLSATRTTSPDKRWQPARQPARHRRRRAPAAPLHSQTGAPRPQAPPTTNARATTSPNQRRSGANSRRRRKQHAAARAPTRASQGMRARRRIQHSPHPPIQEHVPHVPVAHHSNRRMRWLMVCRQNGQLVSLPPQPSHA